MQIANEEQRLVATPEMANANLSPEALALHRHDVRTVRSVLLAGHLYVSHQGVRVNNLT